MKERGPMQSNVFLACLSSPGGPGHVLQHLTYIYVPFSSTSRSTLPVDWCPVFTAPRESMINFMKSNKGGGAG